MLAAHLPPLADLAVCQSFQIHGAVSIQVYGGAAHNIVQGFRMLDIASIVAFPMPLGTPVSQVVVQFGTLEPGDSGTATVAAAAGESVNGVGLAAKIGRASCRERV